MILYPTETVYGLGVNALDIGEVQKLFELKGRSVEKMVSWLVRDVTDIEKYATLSEQAKAIAEAFLPGKITLLLPVRRDIVSEDLVPSDLIGIRVSSDVNAQRLINRFMKEHNAPLTCTSANVSGQPTLATPAEILKQFGDKSTMIDTVINDGSRIGSPSTVVSVVGNEVKVIREGEISHNMITGVCEQK